MPSSLRTLVLLPALNEAAAIADVIADIRRQTGLPVLVIDDASVDATRERAAAAGARVLPLSNRLGAWGATQAGIRYALKHHYELIISMDADGQHVATYIQSLIAPILRGEADVAIGTYTARGSALRKFAWRLMKTTSGITLDDVTSGFRAYNRTAALTLAGREASVFTYQDIGVLALLVKHGMRIVDVPVVMHPRASGQSRVFNSWLTVIYYMLHTLLLGFTKRPLLRRRLPRGSTSP